MPCRDPEELTIVDVTLSAAGFSGTVDISAGVVSADYEMPEEEAPENHEESAAPAGRLLTGAEQEV